MPTEVLVTTYVGPADGDAGLVERHRYTPYGEFVVLIAPTTATVGTTVYI